MKGTQCCSYGFTLCVKKNTAIYTFSHIWIAAQSPIGLFPAIIKCRKADWLIDRKRISNEKKDPILLVMVDTGFFSLPIYRKVPEIPTLTNLPTFTELPTLTLLRPILLFRMIPKMWISQTRLMLKFIFADSFTHVYGFSYADSVSTPIAQNVYITVTPYKTPTALIPSEIEQEFPCGGKISFAFSYMNPKIQRTLTERFPVGSFLLLQVKLRSLDGSTIQPLQSESFQLYGSLWGRDVRFDLDRSNSDYANSRWSTPDLNTSIGTNSIYTFLVFDINPETQNFELEFSPIPKDSESAIL